MRCCDALEAARERPLRPRRGSWCGRAHIALETAYPGSPDVPVSQGVGSYQVRILSVSRAPFADHRLTTRFLLRIVLAMALVVTEADTDDHSDADFDPRRDAYRTPMSGLLARKIVFRG